MLRLFLENRELELDENIQFAITRQFEDITNPTTIINDWSKTVKIPSTPNNDKIFGHIFSVDRTIVKGSNKLGIYFNPYKKIDFRLVDDSNVILTGYAKNISIDKDYYNLTLNGELGKVFQEMKKITFDTKTEDAKYLIDGSKYVKEQINKDLIWELWRSGSGLDTTLRTRDERDYRLEEILGFAPNNSYSDGFDYKVFQMKNSNTSKKFSEILDEQAGEKYEDATGIAADTVIGDGLLPREIGEYRSYYQLPYIYFNKLFQIFTKKTEEITDYKIELDDSWFTEENPYWSKLVYLLKNIYQKTTASKEDISDATLGEFENNGHNSYTPSLKPNGIWQEFDATVFGSIHNDFLEGKIDSFSFDSKIPLTINLDNCTVNNNGTINTSTKNYVILSTGTYFNVGFRVKDESGNVVYEAPSVKLYTSYNGRWNYTDGVVIDYFTKKGNGNYEVTVDIPFGLTIDRGEVGDDYSIEVVVYSYTPRSDIETILYGTDVGDPTITNIPSDGVVITPSSINFSAPTLSVDVNIVKRSNSSFTLNDLWNNEFNLFDEILNYCKQFRIGVLCDYINKKLIFKPLNKYFNEYTIEDWTDKIDYSKDYHIEPITFQNNYILFNYKENDIALNTKYKEKYGLNFGEYKLLTDYEFNNDTKKLFENSKIAIPSTDVILSWDTIYDNLRVGYTLPAEISINNRDKEKKDVELFGNFLFYNGLKTFDTTSGLRSVSISDDTLFQTLNKTYFYSQDGDANKIIKVSTYPSLDIVYGENLCTYTTPSENYTYLRNNYDNKLGIYKNFWENYINERYNIQNKIVTCYVYIKPNEFADFKFNKFVKINNQLYFVNKIYDYDIDATTPTKVDLITVQDIEGYTKNEFRIFNIYYKNGDNYELWNDRIHYIDLDPHTSNTIYITSNTDIDWSADQGIQNNLEVNGEVGYGRIQAGNKVPVTLFNDEYGLVEGYIEFSNGRDTQKIFVRVR